MYLSYNSDMGRVRNENQDKICAGFLSENAALAVVCDGMGGEASGSVASDLAANQIYRRISEGYQQGMKPNSIRNLMVTAVQAANSIVYEKSCDDIEKNGMGTTCVAVLVEDKTAYIVNVGDSRAYMMDGDGIRQISDDHTYVNELYKHGEITFEEMQNHKMKYIITRAVGVEPKVEADYFEVEETGNFAVFLCTDGLTAYCHPQLIYESVFNKNLDKGVSDLIDYCNACGGKDNISAAVIAN
ncbi:Stp1/IreP family PP2C-type Ser/Thr phosphatase [Ruminococcus sp. 210702-SL.1.03]|uniref:Stp1/IreP family PP2C-type Ser/Thr phosphatase n=1 Tax=Ruminococcus sp. 210702-SL.1.03 TaxID=2883233 RepID=UPI001D08C511|nr:Stp1/IreP family PP2C-type Ser/Thr phosphatase [Ruminococcus sp. 210702-SL.1.03]MCB6615484.1 Stp1/IreP family PP2C-type Ser/Thr phosphatase [Ruminococcus sp. 210702-SL.1.03]